MTALHPLLRAPAILVVDTLRRRSPTVERLQDRYARRRRETWWRNEMGRQAIPLQARRAVPSIDVSPERNGAPNV